LKRKPNSISIDRQDGEKTTRLGAGIVLCGISTMGSYPAFKEERQHKQNTMINEARIEEREWDLGE